MKHWSLEKREQVYSWFFLAPALILFSTFILVPMMQAFYYSLCKYNGFSDPVFVGLKNFKIIFKDRIFLISLLNSFIYLLVTPALLLISILLSMLVNQKMKGVNFFRTAYYLPVVTPVVVVGLMWKQIFNGDYGTLNTILEAIGFIDKDNYIPFLTSGRWSLFWIMFVTVWKGVGYYMVIFLAGLKAIPNQLVEAARIDGVNKWQQFWNITIPMLMPSIILTSVLSSISALKVFEEVFMMLGKTGGNYACTTTVLRIYEIGFAIGRPRLGQASAMSIVLFACILVFSIINICFLSKRGYQGEV